MSSTLSMIGWLIVEKIRDGHPTTLGAASGAVAGLVAITPAAGFISPVGSIILGLIAGAVCAACTTLSFVPQVLKIWRTRSAADISGGMYVLFIVGLALWLVYGAALKSWPIVCANTATIALAAAVLWMKWHFGRPRRS